MKIYTHTVLIKVSSFLLLFAALDIKCSTSFAQGTAFTYQGRLNVAGSPANGTYDFQFRLAADPLGNNHVGSPFATNGINVANGLFTCTMDFGPGVFAGSNYWLEVDVRTNNGGSYTGLTPLQPLTPAPYAIYATSSSNLLGTVQSSQLSGAISNVNLPANPNFSGTVTGANYQSPNGSFIAGVGNTDTGTNDTIAGGYHNTTQDTINLSYTGMFATIGGGGAHAITNSVYSTVGGGFHNIIQPGDPDFGGYGTIGGGQLNTIQAGSYNATVGGGYNNTISANAENTTIGGGSFNIISPDGGDDTIAGGSINRILAGNEATIGGGTQNKISGAYGVIAGGGINNIDTNASFSTISGGYANHIESNAVFSVISGGYNNIILSNGAWATIPGGSNNVATNYAFAAGNNARAINTGAFVWADSQNAVFASTAPNQFSVRAGGGVQFVTGSAGMTLNGLQVITSGGSSGVTIQQNTNGAPNVIEGTSLNYVSNGVVGATISGGGATNVYGGYIYSNSVTADFGTVGGGNCNVASGENAVVAGGGGSYGNDGNTASGGWSSVLGGYDNTASGGDAAVGGGSINLASGAQSVVGGGEYNHATGDFATVSGGIDNLASGLNSVVVGGGGDYVYPYGYFNGNTASGDFSTILGGRKNNATNTFAVVVGGVNNIAGGANSFAAGSQAQALHQGSFVWADSQSPVFASTAVNQFSVRAGGGVQFVTGGAGMTLDGLPVIASGGGSGLTIQQNSSGAPNVIAGSSVNSVSNGVVGATVAGGGATNYNGTGPFTNYVAGDFGTVSGGKGNSALGLTSTVIGGAYNVASGTDSTVGGVLNEASGFCATAIGGSDNFSDGYNSTVGGGNNNRATNSYATVPGGSANIAGGQYSFAAGNQAEALHQGSFVWADSQSTAFASTTNNQYLIRAVGGVGIGTNNPTAQLQVTSGGSVSNPQLRLDQTNSGDFARLRMTSGTTGGVWDVAAGGAAPAVLNFFVSPTAGATGTNVLTLHANGNATVWGTVTANGVLLTSDRNAKENFAALDSRTVLDKVASLQLTEWNYKKDSADLKHVGPMAQDFHKAFGLNGEDDKHINVIDENGVALAAIQGLNQKVEGLKAENAQLKQRLEALEKLVQNRR